MTAGEPSVTLADVYELIAKEHAITSTKLEALRSEGRMREDTLMRAIAQTEINMRRYVDDVHQEIRGGVENETTCLQTGLDQLHKSIFGNGEIENSLAFRLAEVENSIKDYNRVLTVFLVPITLSFILGTLALGWMLLSGQVELIFH